MFARRSLLSKSRTEVPAGNAPQPGDTHIADLGRNDDKKETRISDPAPEGNESSQKHKGRTQNSQRGLTYGRVKPIIGDSSQDSSTIKRISQGSRAGLSFTEDIEDEGVAIRKGLINLVTEHIQDDEHIGTKDGEGDSEDCGTPSSLKRTIPSRISQPTVQINDEARDMCDIYVDTVGGDFQNSCNVGVTTDHHANNSANTIVGMGPYSRSNRRMLGVIAGDSDEEELEYYDTEATDAEVRNEEPLEGVYDYIALSPFLNNHLDAIRDGIESVRQKLEATRIKVKANMSEPRHQQEVTNQIQENLDKFETLTTVAKALGGLRIAKLNALTKSVKGLYNNRKDIADSNYRMQRWLLCDMLRTSGIKASYSCGHLDEMDDDGHDVAEGIRDSFENRMDEIQRLKAEQRTQASHKLEMSLQQNAIASASSYMTESTIDLLILCISSGALKKMYPSLLELEPIELSLMDDVLPKYQSVSTALVEFEALREHHLEEFNQLHIEDRLRPIIMFYALLDLLNWDPIGRGDELTSSLTEREWFRYVKSFSPDYLPSLVSELMMPAAINAIDSWDITSSTQSKLLSGFLADVIANLPDGIRNNEIEKLSVAFFKALETRIPVICMKNLGTVISDPWLAGHIRFQIVKIAKNIMSFSAVFTGQSISKVVLQKLFMEYLMPILDFQMLMDAFAVACFFTFTKELSPLLRIKNKNNAIIKSTAYGIAERRWIARSDADGVLQRLNLKFTNEEYLSVIDAIFDKGEAQQHLNT